jgi:sulfatase-like protein
MSAPSRPAIRQWFTLAAALLVLNFALTLGNVWPTPWIEPRPEISVEVAALVLGLAAYAELAARRGFAQPGRRTALWLAALMFVLTIGRYADVTAPALYGRPVNLYWDARHLPNVGAMLAEVAKPWMLAAFLAGLVAFVALIGGALYFALARVERSLTDARSRRPLGALAAVLVAAYFVGYVLEPIGYWFSAPVLATYRDQLAFVLEARSDTARRALPDRPLAPSDLGRVRGADVLLIFLESYGAVTYDSPPIAEMVANGRRELAAAAAATGREVSSAFVESTTFGGSSWLAHSSLLTGLDVREPGTYDLLLTQERPTLPKRFASAGYRTLAVMPGLKNDWPEGGFYGFDSILGEHELDYRGPEFGWWRIPDQYSLAKLDSLALTSGARARVFLFFPTINTHIPFRPTPPYQADWNRVLGAHPFDDDAAAASIAQSPDWASLEVPYAESFVYTLKYLGGYLRARPDADFVLVLLGDHQPASIVTGVGARWDVPVHVITTREAVTRALRDAGFVAGLDLTPTSRSIGGMAELTTILLRAFDSHGAESASDDSQARPD